LARIIRKREIPSINAAYRHDVYSILIKMCVSKEKKTRTTIKFYGSNSMQFFFDRYAKDAFSKSVVMNANVFRCVFSSKVLSRRTSKDKRKKEYVGLNIFFFQVHDFYCSKILIFYIFSFVFTVISNSNIIITIFMICNYN